MGVGKRSSERALQKVLGKGKNVNEANPLEVHDPKVGSLISYEGVTTADGAGDGSTLIDSVLTTKPDYNGNLVIITSGAYAGQGRDINAATTGGTVTPASAFGGQILSGTNFVIVALRLTPAEVAAIEAKLDHASHGLAALKLLIDAVEGKLDDGTTGLAALKALIDAVEGKLDHATYGLSALLTAITDNFDILNALLVLMETGGTLTTDGTEQNLYINDAPAGVFEPKKVWIDFTNQTATETVVVRLYRRFKAGGGYIKVDEVTFAGAQDPEGRDVELGPNRFGIKVTIEKTAGDNLAYDWDVSYKA